MEIHVLNKKKIVIWAVILGILVSVIIFLVIKFGPFSSEQKSFENSIAQPLDLQQYESWVVYNNQTLKISMEIPPEWSIDEERNTENEPTGVIKFTPSTSASPSAAVEIVLTVEQNKQAMSTAEEFAQYKNSQQFSQPVADYTKLGVTQAKNGEALTFQKQVDGSFELLGWFNNGNTNFFVETKNSEENKDEAILFHRYLISTVTLL